MRCTQTLRVLLAVASALTLLRLPSAAADHSGPPYTLPPKDYLGCPAAHAGLGECTAPSYRGNGGIYDCSDLGPEQAYVKDRDAKIKALTEQVDALEKEREAKDAYTDTLQTLIDQGMASGIDAGTLHNLENQYSEGIKEYQSLTRQMIALEDVLYFLRQEKDKTVSDFQNTCKCQNSPNKPQNGISAGVCR